MSPCQSLWEQGWLLELLSACLVPFVPGQVLCLTSLWAAGGETVYGSRLLFHSMKAHFLPEESFSPPALILAWL